MRLFFTQTQSPETQLLCIVGSYTEKKRVTWSFVGNCSDNKKFGMEKVQRTQTENQVSHMSRFWNQLDEMQSGNFNSEHRIGP